MEHRRHPVLQQALRPRHLRRRQRRRSRPPLPRAAAGAGDAGSGPAGIRRVRVRQRRPRRRGARRPRRTRRPPGRAALCRVQPRRPGRSVGARHHGRSGSGVLPQRRRRAHAGDDPRPQPPHPAGLQPGPRRQLRPRRPARLRPRRQDGRRRRHRQDRRARRSPAVALPVRRPRLRPVPRRPAGGARRALRAVGGGDRLGRRADPELPPHRSHVPPDRRRLDRDA